MVVVALLAASTVAHADGEYPETSVDRPLVMYGGMTFVDVAADFYAHTDAGATKVSGGPDIALGHSYGPVQVSGRLVGISAIAGATVQVGCDGVIFGSVAWVIPNSAVVYGYAQDIGYSHRLVRIDHRFALFARAGASLAEASLTPSDEPATRGVVFVGRAGASATVQLLPRLALFAGLTVSGPFARSGSLTADDVTGVGGNLAIQQTLHHWDLYANASINDFTSTARVFWSAGFIHRWGG